MGKESDATLAEQCADLVIKWLEGAQFQRENHNNQYAGAQEDDADELAALPAVAAVLAKRGKAEK